MWDCTHSFLGVGNILRIPGQPVGHSHTSNTREWNLIFVHIAENLFHGSGADGVAKIQLFQSVGCNVTKQRKCEKKSTETSRPLRLLIADVLI
jgi:hypothetical protein